MALHALLQVPTCACIQYLRRYATPGQYPTREDAEDAIQNLFAKKWEGIVRNYDPAKGDNERLEEGYRLFWTYLKTCLDRVCKSPKPLPPGFDLRLMSVAAVDGLGKEGRNLVIVALVGPDLHIRIFDASGNKVVDKAESELVSGETLTALKKQLTPIPDESGLSKKHKQKIIGDATSIAGHTRPPPIPPLPPGPQPNGPDQDLSRIIERCLQRLAQKDSRRYEVFVLHEIDGCSHIEISRKLGITETYSKQILMRARLCLRECLEGEGIHP